MNLVIVGDSLTQGVPGCSYVSVLKRMLPSFSITALGLGGDTLLGISQRITAYLSEAGEGVAPIPEVVVIEAGANDILMPLLERRGMGWEGLGRKLRARGSLPTSDPSEFGALYRKTVNRILEAGVRKVVAVTIACLGEVPSSPPNRLRDAFNAEIRKLDTGTGIAGKDHVNADINMVKTMVRLKSPETVGARPYPPAGPPGSCVAVADAAAEFDRYLINSAGSSSPYLLDSFTALTLDGLQTSIPGIADNLSKERGLRLTVDGVHFNSRGAEIYARCIADRVLPYP
ncbi:MAG TPA: SGNH/GDSL hydrolase family protein [Firmicutes bacterium]|nr:SGNH/GDSL hydrolase family protein [Bacillota bacterium]